MGFKGCRRESSASQPKGFFSDKVFGGGSLKSILWSMDSLKSHRLDKIVFGVEAADLVCTINKSRAWPSFYYQAGEVCYKLEAFALWRMENEVRSTNRRAFLIAQSVTNDSRFQSYVAIGFPSWLQYIFD